MADKLTADDQIVWTLTAKGWNVVTRADPDGFLAECIKSGVSPWAYHYYLTEKDAIQEARKRRIAQMDRLQIEINALDYHYEHLEGAEMKDFDESIKERR